VPHAGLTWAQMDPRRGPQFGNHLGLEWAPVPPEIQWKPSGTQFERDKCKSFCGHGDTPLGDFGVAPLHADDYARSFREGTVMDDYAVDVLRQMLRESGLKANLRKMPPRFPHISGCSGSGMDKFVGEAVQGALLKEAGVEVKLDLLCLAEIVKAKIEFLSIAVADLETHVFASLAELVKPEGKCGKHRRKCSTSGLEEARWGSFGISCKDFSRLNNEAKKRRISIRELDDAGSSTTTIRQVLDILDGYENLDVVILENVDTMADADFEESHYALVDHLGKLGFSVRIFTLNSKDFAVPQRRKRMWFVAIRPCSGNWRLVGGVTS
jgi:hypothetical protein